VIGQERLQKQSAISFRRTRGGFAIDAVRPNGVDRPWSPAVDDQTEPENSTARPAPARPVDATPAAADLQAED
jgi:competence protein ComEC